MSEEMKKQLTHLSNWYRPLTVIGVLFLFSLVGGPLITLYLIAVVAQWVMSVLLGSANQTLAEVLAKVNAYVHRTMQYLSGDSDERPFPISMLP